MPPASPLSASQWSPTAPVGTVTLDIVSSDPDDLVIRADGTIRARGGDLGQAGPQPGLIELAVTFVDGSVRTVHILTPLQGGEGEDATSTRTWVDRIAQARSLDDDALTIVLRPIPHADHESGAPSPAAGFARQAIRAGAHVVVSTHPEDAPRVEVVQQGLVVAGAHVSLDLRPAGSCVRISVPGPPTDPEALYTAMLRTAVRPEAVLQAVEPTEDGGFRVDLDAQHRVPSRVHRRGVGTALTVWEDEPVALQFDRAVPARMVMWERELKRRGATVQTIGTRVLFGRGPTGTRYLVHVTETDRTGIPGSTASGDKRISRKLLQKAGVRTAAGEYFSVRTPVEDALHMLTMHASLVLKPVDGHAGRGVTVGVSTPEEFRAAWQVAADHTRTGILVEEQFVGEDVRISVVDGTARAANQRVPPQIVGDGTSTVRDLINAKNHRRYDNIHLHAKPIRLTPHRLARLESAGLTPSSVLPAGQTFVIDHKANLATGGDPVDMTDTIHPTYLRVAERAAAAFPGLGIAGIDLLLADPTRPADNDSHIVVEVNSLPDIASHGTAYRGTPRNVIGHAADLLLSPPQVPEHIRRRTRPAHVAGPTSAALLAAEMTARGFTVDWLSPALFFATGHGMTLGFHGAMTDRTSHAARRVLQRPVQRRRILDSAGLPQPEAKTFGSLAREQAWRHARRLGTATLQFGGYAPLDMRGMSRAEFDEAWSQHTAVIRSHRAAVAERAPGDRYHLLVAHGRVLGVLRIDRTGAPAGRVPLHRSYRRLAADAARACAGADLVCVSLILEDARTPATADSVVVEDVSIDPDLVAFARDDRARVRLARRIIDLHLGAAKPAPEPEDVWQSDAAAGSSPGPNLRSRVSSAVSRLRRRLSW